MIEPDRTVIEKIVFLKTDSELLPRIITGYKVTKNEVTYELTCGTVVSWHYIFEFTEEKESIIKPCVGFGA